MLLQVLLLASWVPAQDPQEEPADPLDWVRKLDELHLEERFGDFEFRLTGELDLEFFFFHEEAPGISLEEATLRERSSNGVTQTAYKRTRQEDGPEAAGRLQLFLDGSYEKWLTWFVEGRADHGAPFIDDHSLGARFEQYWLRIGTPDFSALDFEIGKFPAPIGNFISRHYPTANPMTTFPLPYDQPTTFMSKLDTPAAVLARRDKPVVKDWRVPIWEEDYGEGAMAFGSLGAFDYAVAATNSAPASWPFDWGLHNGDFRYPNVYVHTGYAPDVSTKLGATFTHGPDDRVDASGIPPGRDTGDYPQTLFGADFEYSRGDLRIFSEFFWTQFEAPLISRMDLWTWYIEAKYTFEPGLFGAVRFAQMFFGQIRGPSGEMNKWDRDQTRVEVGGGYFFTRNFFYKATLQLNYTMGGRDANDNMLMMQIGITF